MSTIDTGLVCMCGSFSYNNKYGVSSSEFGTKQDRHNEGAGEGRGKVEIKFEDLCV